MVVWDDTYQVQTTINPVTMANPQQWITGMDLDNQRCFNTHIYTDAINNSMYYQWHCIHRERHAYRLQPCIFNSIINETFHITLCQTTST